MIIIEHVTIMQLDYKTNNIANICNLTSFTNTKVILVVRN